MRQAGFLAAAGIYALDNHIHRLKEDHKRARELQHHLLKQSWVQHVMPVDTNIVLFQLSDGISPDLFIQKFKDKGVLFVSIGGGYIRAVTHLDFTDDMLERTLETFSNVMR